MNENSAGYVQTARKDRPTSNTTKKDITVKSSLHKCIFESSDITDTALHRCGWEK